MRMTASWLGRYGPTEYKVVGAMIRARWQALLGPFRRLASARLQAVAVWLIMTDRRRLADEL